MSDHSIAMDIPVLPYTIERVLTRQIAKFGVQGTEYRLRVEPINDGIPYVTAVDMIHDMFDREYFIFMFLKLFFLKRNVKVMCLPFLCNVLRGFFFFFLRDVWKSYW